MTRDFLRGLNLEEDVIKQIMTENGNDINKAKAEADTLKADIATKEKAIEELNAKIKGYDGTDETIKDLKAKVKEYETAEATRKEAEEKARVDAEYKNRFTAVVGDKKFKHSDIENGRFEAFKTALADEANVGKGDADIFEAITKDMDCFENPQHKKIILGAAGSGKDDTPTFKSFF